MNYQDIYSYFRDPIANAPQTTMDNWDALKKRLNIGGTGQGLLPDLESAGRNAVSDAKWNLGRSFDQLQNYLDPSYSPPASTPESRAAIDDKFMNLGSSLMPGGMAGVIKKTRIGDIGFDPRFDPRKKEQTKLNNLTTTVDAPEVAPAKVSLADYEGHPFITSMSDRTNVGNLVDINGVPIGTNMQGGQDFMHNNPGMVWASAKAPVNQIMKLAKVLRETTGNDPLYMPWRMAPTGGDFANMTGETMLRYISNNMTKKDQRGVNSAIKEFLPGFKGVGSEEGISQFRSAPDKTRKALKKMLDRDYRDKGGLSIGEARLAVSDPLQLNGADSGLQNVGIISAKSPVIQHSGHTAYPKAVPGEGIGVLDRDIRAYELLKDAVRDRGITDPRNPSQQDVRALQMKPFGGIITADILKKLGY